MFDATFGRFSLGSRVASLFTLIVLKKERGRGVAASQGNRMIHLSVLVLMDSWVVFHVCQLRSVLMCVFLNTVSPHTLLVKCGELSRVY